MRKLVVFAVLLGCLLPASPSGADEGPPLVDFGGGRVADGSVQTESAWIRVLTVDGVNVATEGGTGTGPVRFTCVFLSTESHYESGCGQLEAEFHPLLDTVTLSGEIDSEAYEYSEEEPVPIASRIVVEAEFVATGDFVPGAAVEQGAGAGVFGPSGGAGAGAGGFAGLFRPASATFSVSSQALAVDVDAVAADSAETYYATGGGVTLSVPPAIEP